MKRALLFLTAGLLSLMLFGSLAGCGDQNTAPKSYYDQMKSEIKAELKAELTAELGTIQPSAAAPAPAAAAEEEEEEEEDQFGC
jgi:hypothetical protein